MATNKYQRPNSRRITLSRVVGAWLVGGGIWVLGMFGLMATPVTADVTTSPITASDYYTHAGSWRSYTDPTGKYTIVIRTMVPAGGL